MGSSFLTVNSAWERYIESAECVYRGMEESVKRRLIKLATSAKEMMMTREWEKDLWLAQLDWTLKKVGKSRGVVSSVFFFVTVFLLKLC
jgi:DNA polymerase gamma 1